MKTEAEIEELLEALQKEGRRLIDENADYHNDGIVEKNHDRIVAISAYAKMLLWILDDPSAKSGHSTFLEAYRMGKYIESVTSKPSQS